MRERTVFCEKCRDDVAFAVKEKQLEGTIKGDKYSYKGKEAFCIVCGSEVYIEEINDFNLESLYDVYREKNGIISLENIIQIPEK